MPEATPPAPAAPPAGGTPPLNDFVKGLPADLQTEKCLHTMDSAATLAKGYVHAQKMIGTKRLEVPGPHFNEGQWNEFFEAGGRPKTADEYKLPVFKSEKNPELKIDSARMKPVFSELHKAGLNQAQVDVVMRTYYSTVDADVTTTKGSQTAAKTASEAALKAEWGDKYDVNLDLAKAVVQKFGDEDFMKYIAEGGGNDPKLIKTLSRLGAAMMEDKSRGGGAADGLMVTDATKAAAEIVRLKKDPEFMKALTTKSHPSHRDIVTQWANLHKIATPNNVVIQPS